MIKEIILTDGRDLTFEFKDAIDAFVFDQNGTY